MDSEDVFLPEQTSRVSLETSIPTACLRMDNEFEFFIKQTVISMKDSMIKRKWFSTILMNNANSVFPTNRFFVLVEYKNLRRARSYTLL